MKIKEEILKRFESGKYSMTDYKEVKKYFEEKKYSKNIDEHLEEEWYAEKEDQRKNLDHILLQIHDKIIPNVIRKQTRKVLAIQYFNRIASFLFIPILIAVVVLSLNRTTENTTRATWVEIHSPAGARTHFQLPDGSEGWLNSNSSIKYNTSFVNSRNIDVNGEAWFDVVSDSEHPFVVNTPYYKVRVLGTQFNVLSYNDENETHVILQEGKVEVLGKTGRILEKLNENQQLKLNKSTRKYRVEDIDAQSYTSWRDGLLIFKNIPLQEVFKRVGRKYNAEIVVHNKELNSKIFRATFEDETLDEVFKLLSRAIEIRYKIHKRKMNNNDTYNRTKIEIWKTK